MGFLVVAAVVVEVTTPTNGRYTPSFVKADSAEMARARTKLGRRLFEDTRLSRDSTISCATCHMPSFAFAEPRAVSHGIGVRARKRNTPSLIDVAVFHSAFDWDGRAKSLEEQLHGVFSSEGDFGIDVQEALARIAADPVYVSEFWRAFSRQPDVDAMLRALAAFQVSLSAAPSRFERFYLQGDSSALSDSERMGWILFRSDRSGCSGCHIPLPDPGGSGRLIFSDDRAHNLGIGYSDGRYADVGRFAVTFNPSDLGAFRTPSLRNVSLTAPYMHDGSLATLEEVVDLYVRGGQANPALDPVMFPRHLSKKEQADLVAFLRSLATPWLTDTIVVRRRFLPDPP